MPKYVKLLPQSITKLCAELLDFKSFISTGEVWLGRSWLYSGWESQNSPMIVKFCLGHSHLGVAYLEHIIRLFSKEHLAEVLCFERRGKVAFS